MAARCILWWASDPYVGAGQLRQALHDTMTTDALRQPFFEVIKIDYLAYLRPLENMKSFDEMMLSFGIPLPQFGGWREGLLDRHVPWRVLLPIHRYRRQGRISLDQIHLTQGKAIENIG